MRCITLDTSKHIVYIVSMNGSVRATRPPWKEVHFRRANVRSVSRSWLGRRRWR